MEYEFSVRITNIENDKSMWLNLPTTKEDFDRVVGELGIKDVKEDITITDYVGYPDVTEHFTPYESLDHLNYLAGEIHELSSKDRMKFDELLRSNIYKNRTIGGMIDLATNMQAYSLSRKIKTPKDLGEFCIDKLNLYNLKDIPDVKAYVDLEKIGEDRAKMENGKFTENGYLRRNENVFVNYYVGSLETIPPEYRITGLTDNFEKLIQMKQNDKQKETSKEKTSISNKIKENKKLIDYSQTVQKNKEMAL